MPAPSIQVGPVYFACVIQISLFAFLRLVMMTLREKLHVPAEQFKAYFLALLADKDSFPCYRIGIEGFSFPFSSSLGWHSQRETYVPSRITGAEFAIPWALRTVSSGLVF